MTESFDTAVAATEEAAEAARNQEITVAEFRNRVMAAFFAYLDDEDPRDDVESFIAAALDHAGELAGAELFADRHLVASFERQLRWGLDCAPRRLSVGELVENLEVGLATGDEHSDAHLSRLCADGAHDPLFSECGSALPVIDLAARHRRVHALAAAVDPSNPGRLAPPSRDGGLTFDAALDHLAHIAADPLSDQTAVAARDELVELCDTWQTTAPAAVRLPIHLLTATQKERLVEIYVGRRDIQDRFDPTASEGFEHRIGVLEAVIFSVTDAHSVRAEIPL